MYQTKKTPLKTQYVESEKRNVTSEHIKTSRILKALKKEKKEYDVNDIKAAEKFDIATNAILTLTKHDLKNYHVFEEKGLKSFSETLEKSKELKIKAVIK